MTDKLRHISECCNIHSGDSILDAGTGDGSMLPYLAEATGRFGTLDALDINPEALALAHHKHARLGLPTRFFLADVEADPIHQIYDRIIMYDILPHLRRPLDTILHLYSHNLGGAGCLTIAQPTSRAEANALARARALPGHELPPATELTDRLRDYGVMVDYVEDNDEYYIIRLRRH